MIRVRTYVVVVVFDNEPLMAGVTQLHERLHLSCKWVTLASSGSLSNTTTPYVFVIGMYRVIIPLYEAEFNYSQIASKIRTIPQGKIRFSSLDRFRKMTPEFTEILYGVVVGYMLLNSARARVNMWAASADSTAPLWCSRIGERRAVKLPIRFQITIVGVAGSQLQECIMGGAPWYAIWLSYFQWLRYHIKQYEINANWCWI